MKGSDNICLLNGNVYYVYGRKCLTFAFGRGGTTTLKLRIFLDVDATGFLSAFEFKLTLFPLTESVCLLNMDCQRVKEAFVTFNAFFWSSIILRLLIFLSLNVGFTRAEKYINTLVAVIEPLFVYLSVLFIWTSTFKNTLQVVEQLSLSFKW